MLEVVHTVELIPKYGALARHDVTSEMCLEVYDDFYLNNFSDKEWYYTIKDLYEYKQLSRTHTATNTSIALPIRV